MREWIKRLVGIGQPDPFEEAMRRMREARPGDRIDMPAGVSFTTIANARIDGLTASGTLLVSVEGGMDLNVEVDHLSLIRLHSMLGDHLSRQSRSTHEDRAGPV